MGIVIAFARVAGRHASASLAKRDSISINRPSEISGNAVMISGHASRGNTLRCFHARTAPGRRPTFEANTAGPPFSSMMEDGVDSAMCLALPLVTNEGKPIITHGNVTVGNVWVMATDDDLSWKKLTEGHERLIWARERWCRLNDVAVSATSGALAVPMAAGTYRSYERPSGASKVTPLSAKAAKRFGRAFGVRWDWLLFGEGTPFAEMPPMVARTIEAMQNMPVEHQEQIATLAETLAQRQTAVPGKKRRYAQ